MADRLILHVGTMKSGTTFLQNVVSNNRQLLEQQGVHFGGRQWRDQITAAQDVIEHGGRAQPPLAPDGPWQRILDELDAWSGTGLFSVEFLGARKPSKIRQIVESLPDGELTIVLTVRDLAGAIPSMWQESVQNGDRSTWDEYLMAVRDENSGGPVSQSFWRHQGVAHMASRWAAVVGKQNVVVITAPPKGAARSLIWERYAQVLGVDPQGFGLEVGSNPSLGLASTLVLRALNEALSVNELSRKQYHQRVKRLLAKQGMAQHRASEPALGLDEAWVYERSDDEIAALRDVGCVVVGDLEELRSRKVPGVQPTSVSVEQQLSAALLGLEHLVRNPGSKKLDKGNGRA